MFLLSVSHTGILVQWGWGQSVSGPLGQCPVHGRFSVARSHLINTFLLNKWRHEHQWWLSVVYAFIIQQTFLSCFKHVLIFQEGLSNTGNTKDTFRKLKNPHVHFLTLLTTSQEQALKTCTWSGLHLRQSAYSKDVFFKVWVFWVTGHQGEHSHFTSDGEEGNAY